MKKQLTGILAAMGLALASCQTHQATRQEKQAIHGSLQQFQTSVNQRSFADMRAALAPDFRIGGLPTDLSMDGFRAGLENGRMRIEDVQILSLRRQPDGFASRVALYGRKGAAEIAIGFNTSGKIRSIDGEAPGRGKAPRVPDSMTSSFVESGGLMFVKASADGKTGYFLLDTGSSDLLLNPRYFTGLQSDDIFSFSAGAHGVKKPPGVRRIQDFRWGGFRAAGIDAALKDLSNLERPANTPLLGAIGQAQLQQSSIVFDWKTRHIQLFATNKNGTRKAGAPPARRVVIPFAYFLHLPSFPLRVGNREYTMLFDSGASQNLLPDLNGVEGQFHQVGSVMKLSDGGQYREIAAPFGYIDEATLGSITLRRLPVGIHSVPYLDGKGFLGSPLLQQGKMEINFPAKQISFWE